MAPEQREYVPVDLVQIYAKQGLSDSQIADRLKTQGFSQKQIDDALRVALQQEVGAPRPQPARPPLETPTMEFPAYQPMERPQPRLQHEMPLPRPLPLRAAPQGQPVRAREPAVARHPQARYGVPPERVIPQQNRGAVFLPEAPSPEFVPPTREPLGDITVEEIVEGVVEEKWQELQNRLSNFEKRDLQLESQVNDIRKRIGEIESSIKQREQTLLEKLDSVNESMTGVEGRIGSVEKIFKEFLPELTENVRELSQIVEKSRR